MDSKDEDRSSAGAKTKNKKFPFLESSECVVV